jgi:hypothetical protein
MSRAPIDLLLAVGSRLTRLPMPIVFVGGATTGLLVTDPAAPAPRSTLDVDVIVEISGYAAYATELGPALRRLGAREDDSEWAPLCRWILNNVLVDVMPADTRVLGFSSRWYPSALTSATEHRLPDGTPIRVVDAPHFLATKIEAFFGRGAGDFLSSKDMEDIVALVDGRPELHDEVREAPAALRAFIADALERWLSGDPLLDALPGHLPGNIDNYGRARLVADRLRALIALR